VTGAASTGLPFAAPSSLAQLLALLAERTTRGESTALLAGGTDWYVERHAGLPLHGSPLVVDVTRIAALRTILLEGDRLVVGGATTFEDLRRSDAVTARAPLLASMAAGVGAAQIQARGTLGGNLATGSPAADGVAALAALDAGVVLASASGERSVPLSRYYTGYRTAVKRGDEVIARIEIDLPRAGAVQAWRKVGTRRAQAISKVALAAVAVVDGGRAVRLGLGMASVAPTVAFLDEVRRLALSRPLAAITAEELDAATSAGIRPIDDIRSTAAYRGHVARALVRNLFRDLGSPVP
jgi:CO/xanthine dehydrogenase FAD-binding subunit